MRALKFHRVLRELSQDRLAEAAKLSQTTYSRIERGHRAPSAQECDRIATALGVPPNTLFSGSVMLEQAPETFGRRAE